MIIRLLELLEAKVGKCKQEWGKFVHTGVEHEQLDDGSVYCHQKPMPSSSGAWTPTGGKPSQKTPW